MYLYLIIKTLFWLDVGYAFSNGFSNVFYPPPSVTGTNSSSTTVSSEAHL